MHILNNKYIEVIIIDDQMIEKITPNEIAEDIKFKLTEVVGTPFPILEENKLVYFLLSAKVIDFLIDYLEIYLEFFVNIKTDLRIVHLTKRYKVINNLSLDKVLEEIMCSYYGEKWIIYLQMIPEKKRRVMNLQYVKNQYNENKPHPDESKLMFN